MASSTLDLDGQVKLRKLATDKLTQLLQKSVTTMNSIIASDIKKEISKTFGVGTQQESNKMPGSNNVSEIINPISKQTCAKAALQMMKVRKYLMNNYNASSTMMSLTPEVVHQIISTAIETRNMGLIRLVVCEWSRIVDCRALDKCSSKWTNNASSNSLAECFSTQFQSNSSTPKIPENSVPLALLCIPPDEFDWFSRDRLGKIISMNETCEIFSILGMSQCSKNLNELYINARRREYWACPPDIMEIAADVLLQMTNLTILVLRGLCDDYMLKLIGQSASHLKQLDISGSHFVTDIGLKSLFFKDITENPAAYLMKSFIEKNLKNMNPLVNTLETFDISWTNVTPVARQMLHHLPGAFMFKRIFSLSENFAYGHHIFMRKKTVFEDKIPSTKETTEFETALEPFLGLKGNKTFMKIVEQHPWKNCLLHLYQSNDKAYYGLITPNEDERRVYGVVKFQDSVLQEMYSVFPININILGESCPKLQIFRGIVTDVWKMSSSVLPELTILDMHADPSTTKSVLESAPNLRKLRIRIQREQLTDDCLVKDLNTFMCCRTLEELWIAPGTYIACSSQTISHNNNREEDNLDAEWQLFNEVQSNYYSAENPPRVKNAFEKNNNPKNSNTDDSEMPECKIEDLVQLTANFIRTLLKACQKLSRIGDIAWFSKISEKDIGMIYRDLKREKRQVTFIWENQIFPRMMTK